MCDAFAYTVFVDILDKRAAEYIQTLHINCIVEGRTGPRDARMFMPNASVTKAEVATIVYRIVYGNDNPQPSGSNYHTDTAGHRGVSYIDVAYEQGWVDP